MLWAAYHDKGALTKHNKHNKQLLVSKGRCCGRATRLFYYATAVMSYARPARFSSKMHEVWMDRWEDILQYCHYLGHAVNPGEGTPILGHCSRVMTPIFEIFNPIGSLFYVSSRSHWPLSPVFAEKFGFSLSHLVPEILGPKVDLIFHQMHFVSIFSLIFNLKKK